MPDPKHFLERVVRWAAASPEVLAVGLAGSWARGTATEASDIDLVVIVDDWMGLFGDCQDARDEDWGAVVSRRVSYADGTEAEFAFASSAWAATPLDEGTVQVIRDGFKVLGWINYYGRFYRSVLVTAVLQQINEYLIRWALQKYKRLRGSQRRAVRLLAQIARSNPDLFAHWRLARSYSAG